MSYGAPQFIYCSHEKNDCFDSRKKGDYTTRRRKCRECGYKWSTIEFEVHDRKHNETFYAAMERQVMKSYFAEMLR